MYDSTGIIGMLIIGLVIGVIAKFLTPGRDPGGCLLTSLLGIAGSAVGTFLGRLLFGPLYTAHWIGSILGAMIILAIYHMIARRP